VEEIGQVPMSGVPTMRPTDAAVGGEGYAIACDQVEDALLLQPKVVKCDVGNAF